MHSKGGRRSTQSLLFCSTCDNIEKISRQGNNDPPRVPAAKIPSCRCWLSTAGSRRVVPSPLEGITARARLYQCISVTFIIKNFHDLNRSQRSGCSQFGRRGIIVDDGQETTTALVVTAVPDMLSLAPPAPQSLR